LGVRSEIEEVSYFRRVIRIRAEESPSVRLGLDLKAAGVNPEHPAYSQEITPGVVTYREYLSRLATWDPVLICVGIHGEFYKGAENLLYPPEWLNLAERRADELDRVIGGRRQAEAIGCDPGEGVANTAFAIGDKYGLIDLRSFKTTDTSVVTDLSIELMREFNVPDWMFCMDRGGGGKQHADHLRRKGYNVRTVGFGEGVTDERQSRRRLLKSEQSRLQEDRYAYFNRRAQMYGLLRERLDPNPPDEQGGVNRLVNGNGNGSVNGHSSPLPPRFALPVRFSPVLRRQLAVMPLMYDGEGRRYLPPKNRKEGQVATRVKTLSELIGHSPDESDALVLMVYALASGPTGRVGTWG
jgi:hypothetical protein